MSCPDIILQEPSSLVLIVNLSHISRANFIIWRLSSIITCSKFPDWLQAGPFYQIVCATRFIHETPRPRSPTCSKVASYSLLIPPWTLPFVLATLAEGDGGNNVQEDGLFKDTGHGCGVLPDHT